MAGFASDGRSTQKVQGQQPASLSHPSRSLVSSDPKSLARQFLRFALAEMQLAQIIGSNAAVPRRS